MQDRPDKATLLDAVARFLATDLREAQKEPADAAVGFRVLIAANLVQMVAAELRLEDAQDQAQSERLRAIFGDASPQPATAQHRTDRHAAIRAMEADLASRLRDGSLDADRRAAARDHVRATLREKLAVTNARFDLSPTID